MGIVCHFSFFEKERCSELGLDVGHITPATGTQTPGTSTDTLEPSSQAPPAASMSPMVYSVLNTERRLNKLLKKEKSQGNAEVSWSINWPH